MADDIMKPWPKTPRYYREIVVTEKIDGTSGGILILPRGTHTPEAEDQALAYVKTPQWADSPMEIYCVWARSRNRMLSPGADNYGFAQWVSANAYELVRALGVGSHYGEWWGKGIQRGYGLDHKHFSVYSSPAINELPRDGTPLGYFPTLSRVPVLFQGTQGQDGEAIALMDLSMGGSIASRVINGKGGVPAEGVCIFHTQSRQVYKALLENDHLSKTEAGVNG